MKITLESLTKTTRVAMALLTGTDVSEERMKARLDICRNCDKVALQGSLMRCGICKCRLSERGLINLARYETTKSYGCFHPDGDKWKAAGV